MDMLNRLLFKDSKRHGTIMDLFCETYEYLTRRLHMRYAIWKETSNFLWVLHQIMHNVKFKGVSTWENQFVWNLAMMDPQVSTHNCILRKPYVIICEYIFAH